MEKQTIYQNSNLGGRRTGQDRRVSPDTSYKGIEKRISEDRRKGTRQRRFPRFRAKEGSYTAIDSNYSIIGLIKDINKCGLAFQYVANGKKLDGTLTIDIFCSGKAFYLKNVPFKTISDFHVDCKSPFSTIILRQCCGRFDDLTENQISQLDHFIQNYTMGEA
ncbi:MAG: hypothetical protein ABIK98_14450 [Pseudomonadota bacterium]|uniref:PilZ domain-containing protein n=1 Tax=Candidatus Desulfatibia profunda TaxID=2841695 RepID=A0A8J6TMG1_9BACT|nr:hypothetical protein [Candidatus Desulfatibia profunda]MBL7179654.1 hypothetical protein [Desulfobacterales bacterium]MBU0698822.1 hypothetical protein [Pseudomonadota bacterium]MBU1956768.1 hypothetical protein [Patescibacteria group bacterium]